MGGNRKASRLRFSIRTLFVAVAVIAVALGIRIQQVRKQKQAIAALLDAGVILQYDWARRQQEALIKSGVPPNEATVLSSKAERERRSRLFGNLYAEKVVRVWAGYVQDDTWVKWLEDLPHLDSLILADGTTDETLWKLEHPPSLQMLVIDSDRVTHAALASIVRIEGLKELYLWGDGISDKGIAELQAALRNCYLGGPRMRYVE